MTNSSILTVTQFNTITNQLLQSGLGVVQIRGEISQYKVAQAKFAYFSLKDTTSVLNCFALLFRLDFDLEDGQEVVVTGTPSIHIKSGRYSLTVDSVILHGAGAIQKAFQQLQAKLATEGLFDQKHKRPLPQYPQKIGVITSDSGAAIGDIRKVIDERWGGITILLFPTKVQGHGAVEDIVRAIEAFNQRYPVDTLIIGRGGGSLEDLQAFNTERVARAIFSSKIPIISAVGHEQNITISDLVADVRAATPSNSAELTVPDRREVLAMIRHLQYKTHQQISNQIMQTRHHLKQRQYQLDLLMTNQVTLIKNFLIRFRLQANRLRQSNEIRHQQLSQLSTQLNQSVIRLQAQVTQRVHELQTLLQALNPTAVLKRGYSITYAASSNKVIGTIADLPRDGKIKTRLADGAFTSVQQSITIRPKPKINYENKQTTLI